MAVLTKAPPSWWGEMVDGARKAFGLARGVRPARPTVRTSGKRNKRGKLDYRARASLTRRLAEEGFDTAQIARRTGLSQDTVSMLLNMGSERPEETAGNGKFFRTLQSRVMG